MRKLIGLCLALALAPLLPQAAIETAPAKLYAVIFGVTLDAKGQLIALKVEKVIDPGTGSINPVPVAVPNSFIDSARHSVIAKHYKPRLENGVPKAFFIYFFFDPSQPGRTDIHPGAD